jgi:hypothetical protein
MEIDSKDQLKDKLFKSGAVNSLFLERKVFEALNRKKWQVSHSPYYIDIDSKKQRELDIEASKYWKIKEDFSCRVNLLIECKSLKDYHIIVDNKRNIKYNNSELKDFWLGNDSIFHYNRLRKILRDQKIEEKSINGIIEKVDLYLCPNGVFRNADFIFNAPKIDAFNVFRETNIANTKDIDNSVIWKCQQSLSSCVESFEELYWDDIEYSIKEIVNNLLFESGDLIKELSDCLIEYGRYKDIVHPIIILESNLWELLGNELNKINYFRLCFQQLRNTERWVDVVHINHIEEYFNKLDSYDKFLEKIK